jgi:hypothetical protein
MSDGTLIDLDRYRDKRVKDGSWPPTELDDVVEYWRSRRAKKKPEYATIDGPQETTPPSDDEPEPPKRALSPIPTIQPPFPAWMMDIIRGGPYQTPPV